MSRKLKTKQIKAARLVVENCRTESILKTLKIRPETLSRWKRLPAFKQLIDALTQDSFEETRCKFVHLVDASFITLWDAVQGHTTNANRLKAALSVLKLAGIERISVPSVAETDGNGSKQEPNAPPKPVHLPPEISCRML